MGIGAAPSLPIPAGSCSAQSPASAGFQWGAPQAAGGGEGCPPLRFMGSLRHAQPFLTWEAEQQQEEGSQLHGCPQAQGRGIAGGCPTCPVQKCLSCELSCITVMLLEEVPELLLSTETLHHFLL